ncbi:hypothetical protein AUG19_08385 [archaeon 13_1_20CM_2_54_9]|nr:MAG: hypothetical protein AUG19_08385 [archaeon 13_1_20CM_2_54_9]
MWIVGMVSIAAIASIALPYGLSYQSVRGLTVEIVRVSRTYNPSTFASTFSSIEFDVTAHVWSSNALDTRIDHVQFALWVDSVPFPTLSARGSTFSRNNYLQYDLPFVIANSQSVELLAGRNSHQITLSIVTLVQAGIYSTSLSPATSRSVTVQRIVDETISPNVVNECQVITRQVLVSQPGGVTISMSSSPDTLSISVWNSHQIPVFSQESTSFNNILRLSADTYSVRMENPGFFCTGANDQVSGSVQFWHEKTDLVRA